MRRKAAIGGITLGAIALAVAALGVARGWLPVHPLAAHRYDAWGIDVSHHQGAIDWAKVATERRLRFAYLKATEGGDFTDPRFLDNWREARRAGLRVGAYHFFSFCRPGAEQARHFLAAVPRDADALPPALDLELGGSCARRPSRDEVTREVASWLAEVERGTGKRPILYATAESYDLFVRGRELSPPLWMRDVLREPVVVAPHAWVIWQFWPRGRVAGISGPVDLNAARGDRDVLARP
ncbi:glycoside hydrolase family 25 protein [Anaeromyxobacter oryzae]|uniref:Lysozyme n=1 Tax=Anaeromyxobacter oryzae TaxID=2918170 RepID=A0ABN6MTR3_9BACT|nr:glycoside hydrolase family 25 protein [Anaeromyxobacter oryzae]BDG03153.1 lysozyme [Anaeromyxobacter oryzae]